MSEWVDELQRATTEEYGDGPRVCTLATVDKNGAPRGRSVVCRKIAADGALWIVSDSRSEKNDHLKATPQAEIVFWLPTLREQFRLLGSVRIIGASISEANRMEAWRSLSDASRATFLWPSPGAKRIDPPTAFPEAVSAETAPPPGFELVILRPRRVEYLQLAQHPHRRRRWMLAGNWSAAAEVNP